MAEHAAEFREEAGQHGWHGIAERMQEAGEALTAASTSLGTAAQACARAATEVEMTAVTIRAEEVAGLLASSSTDMDIATAHVWSASEEVEATRAAVDEVGQEGMMEATLDVQSRIAVIYERLTQQRAVYEREQTTAYALAKRHVGKACGMVQEEIPQCHPARPAFQGRLNPDPPLGVSVTAGRNVRMPL